MTRRFRWLLTPLLVLALMAGVLPFDDIGQAEAQQFQRFQLQIVGDDQPNPTPITSGRCRVLNAGLQTDATIYTTGSLATAATNPLTIDTSNGTCEWFAATTPTSYDVLIFVTDGPWKGAVVRVDNVTRTGRKNVTVSRSSSMKMLVLTIPVGATAATVTGATIPKGSLVTHTILETTTAVASAVTLVGFDPAAAFGNLSQLCGAADGTMAVVGFINCAPTALFLTAQGTLAYSTQAHASAGYAYVYYLGPHANEP